MSEDVALDTLRRRTLAIDTRQALLTGAWTDDVKVLRAALGRATADDRICIDCAVTFFEVAGDEALHVTVAHRSSGSAPSGAAASATLAEGVSRSFPRMPRYQVLRQIREMVFAGPGTA